MDVDLDVDGGIFVAAVVVVDLDLDRNAFKDNVIGVDVGIVVTNICIYSCRSIYLSKWEYN